MKRTCVAVLTWNRQDCIETMIAGLRATGIFEKCEVAIFEDCGYRDGTRKALLEDIGVTEYTDNKVLDAHEYKGAEYTLFLGKHNLGVAGNSNRAIAWFNSFPRPLGPDEPNPNATGSAIDHLIISNDDVLVKGDFANEFRDAHVDTEIGMFCWTDFEAPEYAGFLVPFRGRQLRIYQRMTGMFMSVTRYLIDTIGYLDASFGKFGEEHSCPGGTPIWMGDFSQKPIEDVQEGDEVIGWTRREKRIYHENAKNPCHRKWSTPSAKRIRPHNALCRSKVLAVKSYVSDCVVRVTMESGRSFVCTADHLWWNYKFQEGNEKFPPYVNPVIGAQLVRVLDNPAFRIRETPDYCRGYVQGAMDGDGCYNRVVTATLTSFQFVSQIVRLSEGIFKITVNTSEYPGDSGELRPCQVLYFHGGQKTAKEFQTWKPENNEQWRGWLAGMYDAEGHGHAIAQTKSANPVIYKMIKTGLARFGFKVTLQKNQLNIRGGRRELLRFYQLTGPVSWYKLDSNVLSGRFRTKDRIVNVEKLPDEKVYCLMTSTGNYVAHGYASKNCDWTNRARLCGFIAIDNRAQQCISLETDALESQKDHESSMKGPERDMADRVAAMAMNDASKKYNTEGFYRPFRLRAPRFAMGREGAGTPIKNLDGYAYVEDCALSNILNE